LSGVIQAVETTESVISLLSVFHYKCSGDDQTEASGSCIVGVVGNGGCVWIKVIARNPQALHRIWQGDNSTFEKTKNKDKSMTPEKWVGVLTKLVQIN